MDACSDTGVGAMLLQVDTQGVEHVVVYTSRILTKAEQNCCIVCKELLAVVIFCSIFDSIPTCTRMSFIHCLD